jgi:hypothetical protein
MAIYERYPLSFGVSKPHYNTVSILFGFFEKYPTPAGGYTFGYTFELKPESVWTWIYSTRESKEGFRTRFEHTTEHYLYMQVEYWQGGRRNIPIFRYDFKKDVITRIRG